MSEGIPDAPTVAALQRLVDQVKQAHAQHGQLFISGGGSKRFYGGEPRGELLDVSGLRGIRSHEPSELVVTVRAGTPLDELEAVLVEAGQCLPFEPPRFACEADARIPGGTVGGMVAAGLSGPARAAVGSVRDHVLGCTLLNGKGELMNFGGTVMKNVAGYDVSRLLAGSLGVLGVICEVSLKVLPIAPATHTLRFEMDEAAALKQLNEWAGTPLPLHASAWWEGMLVVRLSGARAAVHSAAARLGGEGIEPRLAADFWAGLRDQSDEFFIGARAAVERGATLWRISVPPTAPPLKLSGEQLVEWGGAQRWLCTSTAATALREAVAAVGGHATLFMGKDRSAGVFEPLSPALDRIQRQLKRAFDPEAIFNRGRMYRALMP